MTKIKTLLLTLVAMLASTSMFAQTAQIGETTYASLADAVAAVPTDGTQTTITMIANENINVATSPLTITATQNVTIDLNGKVVVGNCESATTSALITNWGTLKLKDSSDTDANGTGTGKMCAGANPAWIYEGGENYAGSYASNVIANRGNLTIESGYYESNTAGSAAYVIDNYTNGVAVINGGHLYNYYTSAIRLFCNDANKENSLTVNGGIIEGYCTIWVQGASQKNEKGSLTINGGTFKTTEKAVVNGTTTIADGSSYMYMWPSNANMSMTINGGTFDTNVCKWGNGTLTITGGTYNGRVYNATETGFITGGKYTDREPTTKYIADGYEAVQITESNETFWLVGVKDMAFTGSTENGTYTGTTTKEVKESDDANAAVLYATTVAVTVSGTNNLEETAAPINADNLNIEDFVETVMEQVALVANSNNTVAVELTVKSETESTTASAVTYEVYPEATVTVNGTGAGSFVVPNSELKDGASFTFNLDVTGLGVTAGDKVKVTHKSDDAAYEDETSFLTVEGTSGNYYVTVTTSHFSTFELTLANSVTLNGEFATYCPAVDVDFTGSELEAYVAISGTSQTGYGENIVYLERVYTVAAGEGVLLRGNTGSYTVSLATGAVESVTNNLFKGVLVDTKIDPTVTGYTNFYLTNQVGGASAPLAFYLVPSAGKTIPAGKAYLQLANEDANTVPAYGTTSAKGLTFVFGDATGIKTVDNATIGNAVIYDLQGRRVQNPTRGIYVVNGKKVVLR